MGFRIPKVWQIWKHFVWTFQTSYFWSVIFFKEDCVYGRLKIHLYFWEMKCYPIRPSNLPFPKHSQYEWFPLRILKKNPTKLYYSPTILKKKSISADESYWIRHKISTNWKTHYYTLRNFFKHDIYCYYLCGKQKKIESAKIYLESGPKKVDLCFSHYFLFYKRS